MWALIGRVLDVFDELLSYTPQVRNGSEFAALIAGILCSLLFANVAAFYGKYKAHQRLQGMKNELISSNRAGMLNGDSVKRRVPITLVTGFLGSGKTTLLNHLLCRAPKDLNLRLMVLVNEFGKLSVDHSLLLDSDTVKKDEDVLQLSNGCMCCAVGSSSDSELERIYKRLIDLPEEYDHVIIETTGLADPQPILSNLERVRMGGGRFYVDAGITVIDCTRSTMSFAEENQIAFADVLLLNKVDRIKKSDLDSIRQECDVRNPVARVLNSTFGRVMPVSKILGVRAFESYRFCERKKCRESDCDVSKSSHRDRLNKSRVSSHTFERPAAVDLVKVKAWLGKLQERCGSDLLRVKGILSIDAGNRQLFVNGVGEDVSAIDAKRRRPVGACSLQSFIVVIARDIEKRVPSFEEEFSRCVVVSRV